jgi:hypothetical protein
MRYDRTLLLGPQRRAVLALDEVERYGRDSYGDPDYLCLYGLRPSRWYAAGVRIAGRTAVECTRDALAERIAADVAAVVGDVGGAPLVVDPFAGSANTLYWLVRTLPASTGVGFESDEQVHGLTAANLDLLAAPVEYLALDYRDGLARLTLPAGRPVVCFVAPPWGDALDPGSGLDLGRTAPPVVDVLDAVAGRAGPADRLLFAVQIHEHTGAASLAEVRGRFDWSARRDYRLTAPGTNHGVLLGTRGWVPAG